MALKRFCVVPAGAGSSGRLRPAQRGSAFSAPQFLGGLITRGRLDELQARVLKVFFFRRAGQCLFSLLAGFQRSVLTQLITA